MTKNTANGQYRLGTGPAKIALYGFVGNSRIRNMSICRGALSDTVVEPDHRLIRPHIAFADKTLREDLEGQSRGTAKAQKSYMKAATPIVPGTVQADHAASAVHVGGPAGSWQDEPIAHPYHPPLP
jgi:hypothetical protein